MSPNYTTELDGNAWICYGDGFVDLQVSDNYAYGDTEEEAITNFLIWYNPEWRDL